MRLRPYQIRTILGGLLLLAVLASSYGLPAAGGFFSHRPASPGGGQHDIPHEGVTHRHAGGGEPESFFQQAGGETHRNADSGQETPDDGHGRDSDFSWHDGVHPTGNGGDGAGAGGGPSHGGDGQSPAGPHGGFAGPGYGAGGFYAPGETSGGGDTPADPKDGSDTPADSSGANDPIEHLFEIADPPGDPPAVDALPSFDDGCASCDLGDPGDGDPQEFSPLGKAPKAPARVPEPSSLLLLASALLIFAGARTRLASAGSRI